MAVEWLYKLTFVPYMLLGQMMRRITRKVANHVENGYSFLLQGNNPIKLHGAIYHHSDRATWKDALNICRANKTSPEKNHSSI